MSISMDLSFAVRSLARVKGLAITVVLTLALGIGAGIAAGAAAGIALAGLAGGYIAEIRIPGALPLVGAAMILVAAAILASLVPAARASRVDVIKALRSD
ncbi:MAG: hypothetical protein ACRD21_14650 [Vicinamibacteria bacterium]